MKKDLQKLYNEQLKALALEKRFDIEETQIVGQKYLCSEGVNRTCGDKIKLYAFASKETSVGEVSSRFERIGFEASCCLLCRASAVAVCRYFEGLGAVFLDGVEAKFRTFRNSLVEGFAPDDPFVMFEVIQSFSDRQNCVELPWLTLQSAIAGTPLFELKAHHA